MKIGIERVAVYLPPGRMKNRPERWGVDQSFLDRVVGIEATARVSAGDGATALCRHAYQKLVASVGAERLKDCELIAVVTQNPDTNMPHTSALLHGLLEMPANCHVFDLSIGCTGFVQGLAIATAFMNQHGLRKGLLFNVEVMSKIVDMDDKATAMIFGDGATVTLLSESAVYDLDGFSSGTVGAKSAALRCDNGRLYMDGQGVYDFVSRNVPGSVKTLLESKGLTVESVDRFIFHQASRRTVEKLIEVLKIPVSKAPFAVQKYGNIGACSIPILLDEIQDKGEMRRVFLCGYGVGLSWANAVLSRRR